MNDSQPVLLTRPFKNKIPKKGNGNVNLKLKSKAMQTAVWIPIFWCDLWTCIFSIQILNFKCKLQTVEICKDDSIALFVFRNKLMIILSEMLFVRRIHTITFHESPHDIGHFGQISLLTIIHNSKQNRTKKWKKRIER